MNLPESSITHDLVSGAEDYTRSKLTLEGEGFFSISQEVGVFLYNSDIVWLLLYFLRVIELGMSVAYVFDDFQLKPV